MADFGELLEKLLAILLSILQALTPDFLNSVPNRSDASFEAFGDIQITTLPSAIFEPLYVGNRVQNTSDTSWTLPELYPTNGSAYSSESGLENVTVTPEGADDNVTVTVDHERQTCRTSVCRDYAEYALRRLNSQVDPCDDFYEYACGGLTSENRSTGNGTSEPDLVGRLRSRVLIRIRGLLSAPSADDDSTARSKAKALYAACVSSDSTDESAVDTLKSILNQIIGGWPLTTPNWNASNFNLYTALSTAKNLGFDLLFNWKVIENPYNPTQNVIQLGQAVLGLQSPTPYNEAEDGLTVRLAYKELIAQIAALISGDNSTDLLLPIRDLLDFEKSLANATVDENPRNESLQTTVTTFSGQYLTTSALNRQLVTILRAVFGEVGLGIIVSGNTKLLVENPRFFGILSSILATEDRLGDDGKITLANYIGWIIISTQFPVLPAEYNDAFEEFARKSGTDPEVFPKKAKWEECVDFVNEAMPNAVGSLYAEKYLDKEDKSKVEAILERVKEAAQLYLNGSAWMDDFAREAASEKLYLLENYAGYPDFVFDNITRLDDEYAEVQVGENHFNNVQNLSRFATLQQLRKLGFLNERKLDDDSVPVSVNINYYFRQNLIAVFAGLLQFPLFDAQAPDYSNYAAIGYFYARVLTDVFDDKGALYNATGFPSAWWSGDVKNAYSALKRNLTKQYRSGSESSGLNSLPWEVDDLLADNLGLQLAFAAFDESNASDPALPDLEEFAQDQQFFISYAQNYCEMKSTALSATASESSASGFNKLRVNIPLSNSVEFGRAFQCAPGTSMNPQQKTVL